MSLRVNGKVTAAMSLIMIDMINLINSTIQVMRRQATNSEDIGNNWNLFENAYMWPSLLIRVSETMHVY